MAAAEVIQRMLADEGLDAASAATVCEIVRASANAEATARRVLDHFAAEEAAPGGARYDATEIVLSVEDPGGAYPGAATVCDPEGEIGTGATWVAGNGDGAAASPARERDAAHTLPPVTGGGADLSSEQTIVPGDPLSARLVPSGRLGVGGMGEVLRAHDRVLHRALAMKVLRPGSGSPEDAQGEVTRRQLFASEAQVTAQLAHPGIPPVHELGVLANGRPFFTMKEVRGRTLADVIRDVREGASIGETPWNGFQLLEAFQKICEAVAYAHSRGVVHCDLKPANVMVGAFGEVLVMDWGLALLVEPAGVAATNEPPVSAPPGGRTARNFIAGTPPYMPPEQAMADRDLLGPPSDVFALGVILYEMVAGRRPFTGTAQEIFWQMVRGEVPPIEPRADRAERADRIGDEALIAIVRRALEPTPARRYPDASALVADIQRWREGALRREKALAVVREAERLLPDVAPIEARAASLRMQAEASLAALGPEAGASDKAPAWALEDEAAGLERERALRVVEATERLQAALVLAPDLGEAKKLLARIAFERHADAERRRAWDEAAAHELVLRAHDSGDYRDYLQGTAAFSLETEPACRVRLSRFVVRGRRLVAEPQARFELGETPLGDVELPLGSYLLELVRADRPVVRLPIPLRRPITQGTQGAQVVGSALASDDVAAARPGRQRVRLPAAGELGDGDIYVPAGFFDSGGDPDAAGSTPARRVRLDAFVIREQPVSCAEFAAFLVEEEGAPFRRAALADAFEILRPDWPAVGASWHAARAYAAWMARRTGLPWRLPSELEWEKAARGVDGRWFPWGDFADASLCHARTAERVPRSPARLGAFASDCSPYGVRGLGGNARDWCADPFLPEGGVVTNARALDDADAGGLRTVRGGSWRQPLDGARAATRTGLAARQGYVDVAFRLVRSIAG